MIVAHDPTLSGELQAGFAPLVDLRPVVRVAGEFREAADAARNWRPDLAFVEMTGDIEALREVADELRAVSPETVVVAVFHPNIFPPDVAESAVMISAIRAGVQDFVPRPISSQDLRQLFERRARSKANEATSLGRIVSFVSNKGGVGKSTRAVNAACGLAQRHPGRVLLVDGSLQMGVCPAHLDLSPATTMVDAVRERDRLDEVFLRELTAPHSSGLELLAAPRNAMEGAEVDDEMISRILTLARRTYDYVVVDTFPLLDNVVMAILDLSDRVYVVVENVVPTILSVARFLDLLDEMGVPVERQRVVLNKYAKTSGNPLRQDVEARLGRAVDHVIPFDRLMLTAANTGRPAVLTASRFFAMGKSLQGLVRDAESVTQRSSSPSEAARNEAARQKEAVDAG